MKHGLIIGKFMPLHQGHLELIRFAAKRCDHLTVLLGALPNEPIAGQIRLNWLRQTFPQQSQISIVYTEDILPSAPVSDREVSKVWAQYLKKKFPETSIIFSSEIYGSYLADYMGIDYQDFDLDRAQIPVSGSQIRENPLRFWEFLPPAVKPYYVKKVCLYGPESTGKSVLTQRLAQFFQTVFVPEMARAIIDQHGISYALMPQILNIQAEEVLKKIPEANKILFCDTDYLTTLIYSREFYNQAPLVAEWILKAHHYDLYLFSDIDTPWIEDQQRFFKDERLKHRRLFMQALEEKNIPYVVINGNWEHRFQQAIQVIREKFALEEH